MANIVTEIQACRVCGGDRLRPFLHLGEQPLANALVREDQFAAERRFPLALTACGDCELIQITHTVAPEILFRNYFYFSSVSEEMNRHFRKLANEVADRFVSPNGLVVEIGSNDGILLQSFAGREVRILGVDPAQNVAACANARGIPTVPEFFSAQVAEQIVGAHGKASAILANNVLAHVHDLDDVVRGAAKLLAADGVLVVEVPYVVDMLSSFAFDTVYHEHLCYFGVRPLQILFGQHGLDIFEVQHQSVHCGTIRVFARHRRADAPVDPSVEAFLALERKAGVTDVKRLREFSEQVGMLRDELRALVRRLREAKHRVVGYTAPAKGTVLLNFCGLGPEELSYLADATPAKQGLTCPGVHIPIVSPDRFRQDQAEYALLLAWNHEREILEKEVEYRRRGGKFIIPGRQLRIV